MFATSRPVVGDDVEASLAAVVDKILDVIISRVAGDSGHNAAFKPVVWGQNSRSTDLALPMASISVTRIDECAPNKPFSGLVILEPINREMAAMAVGQELTIEECE